MRESGYRTELSANGHEVCVYSRLDATAGIDFNAESAHLSEWLKRLPRKTAVYCANDRRAQHLIATAIANGLKVPEDIAVLGTDDEFICGMTTPTISSIPTLHYELGRSIGESMQNLLGNRPHRKLIVTRHSSVATRQSSEADAVTDTFLAKAIRIAQGRLPGESTLLSIAEEIGCSKTTLNAKAQRYFGHSFARELRSRRLNEAIALIRNTTRTIDDIARTCGFKGASHLGLLLRSSTGHTPSFFRQGDEMPYRG